MIGDRRAILPPSIECMTLKPQPPQIESSMIQQRLNLSSAQINQFCRENQIQELAIFGSVLREDFNPDSDLDFLVVFDPKRKLSLMDLVGIQYQLEYLTGRNVDLIEKRSILNSHNWIRRQNIFSTAQIIYESRPILSA